MSIFVEIVLWAMIIIGVALGIKAGFIRMASKPVKLLLSLALAIALCTSFAAAVVVPIIEQPITNYISEFLIKNCPELNVDNIAEELPVVLKMAAVMYGINVEEIVAENAGRDIIAEITAVLAEPVISILSIIISFVVLYFVFKLAVKIVLALVDLIFSKGIFGKLNKALGGVSGAIISFAAAWAVAVLVESIFHIIGSGNENAGIIYTFFNTYSPIELLLSF